MTTTQAALLEAKAALESVDGTITALLGQLVSDPDAPGGKVRVAIASIDAALRAADAAQAGEFLPLLLRDLCRELGVSVPEAAAALRGAGLGDFSQGSAVTPAMARVLREKFDGQALAAQASERAWLVELSNPGYAPQWWGFNHSPRSRGEWCADSNSAVRFARRLDAERMRLHIIAAFGFTGNCSYERSVGVTEHEWGSIAAQAEGAGLKPTKAERVQALVNAGPFPGMSEAFDAHMGAACWTDPAYAPDASTWAAAWKAALAAQAGQALVPLTDEQIDALRGLDTASRVRFYEHDFYVLSNFSAFNLERDGLTFPTSEHAYHYEKFATDEMGPRSDVGYEVMTAPSAHEAFKIAERNKHLRRPDWDAVKVGIMLDILRVKAEQHEYVRRKLLDTGDRELVEDSWRDDFWGWGPNRDGKNMLGRLWMQVRAELRADAHNGAHAPASTRPADASISGRRVDMVQWRSPDNTESVPRLMWLREGGSVFLGYYFVQQYSETRDNDGRYIDHVDADAFWARYEDGERCEPDGWCELQPPALAAALQAPATAQPERRLSPFDAVARAMDMASLLAGAVAANNTSQADSYAARLRSHLIEFIYPAPQAPAEPAAQGVGKPLLLRGVGKINGDGWKDTTRIGEVVYAWNAEKPAPYVAGQFPRLGHETWTASTDQYDFEPVPNDDLPEVVDAAIEELRAELADLKRKDGATPAAREAGTTAGN